MLLYWFRINLTDQVSASLSNNIPNPTNPFPAAGSTENLTETLPSEPTQSNEAVSEVTNDAQNVDSIPSTSSDNLTETSHIRKRHSKNNMKLCFYGNKRNTFTSFFLVF